MLTFNFSADAILTKRNLIYSPACLESRPSTSELETLESINTKEFPASKRYKVFDTKRFMFKNY